MVAFDVLSSVVQLPTWGLVLVALCTTYLLAAFRRPYYNGVKVSPAPYGVTYLLVRCSAQIGMRLTVFVVPLPAHQPRA